MTGKEAKSRMQLVNNFIFLSDVVLCLYFLAKDWRWPEDRNGSFFWEFWQLLWSPTRCGPLETDNHYWLYL